MLDDHVSACTACCALLRRLEAGERAFERPPRVPLPPGVLEEIVLALVYAAPLRPHAAEPNAVRSAVLRLFALTAGAPIHDSPAVGTTVTHEPRRPPVDVRPRATPQLKRPKIARTRMRPGPDLTPRPRRAQRRRRATGERSRRSSLLVTAVAVAASSGGIVILNSWSADDSAWRSTPQPTRGAEFGAPGTTNLRQPQHPGAQRVRRSTAGGAPVAGGAT